MLEDRLVAIIGTNDKPAGAGLLIDDDLVITCAHVVNAALGYGLDSTAHPANKVPVRLHGASKPVDTKIDPAKDGWRPPPASKEGGDLCILRLPKGTTKGRGLAHLREYADMNERRFRALGYPADWGEIDEAVGRVLARDEAGLYMLGSEPREEVQSSLIGGKTRPAGAIHRGFSGGPVESGNAIVGLVAMVRDAGGATAYIIPVSAFGQRFEAKVVRFANRVSEQYQHVGALVSDIDVRLGGFEARLDLRMRYCDDFPSVLNIHRSDGTSSDYTPETDLTPYELASDLHLRNALVLLHAPGGAGKSTFLSELLLAAPDENLVPFLVDFSRRTSASNSSAGGGTAKQRLIQWFEEYGQAGDAEAIFELARDHDVDMKPLLVIDGINQVVMKWNEILLTLVTLSRGSLARASIVVSDRMVDRQDAMQKYQHAAIPPLAPSAYKAALKDPSYAAIVNEGSWLPILTSPIFLNLLLTFPRPQGGVPTRFELLNDYFTAGCGLSKDDLRALADFAYSAYRTNRRTAIPRNDYEQQLPVPLRQRIEEKGLIHEIAIDEVEFRHQLLHDALAALKVASASETEEETLVRGPAFDVLSLNSASGDPIELAVEALLNPNLLLGNRAKRPQPRQFLAEVFDWNYWITFHSVASFDRRGRSPLPAWVRHAIYGMNMERLFDPYLHTADRAQRLRDEIPLTADLTYLDKASRAEMAEDVARCIRESSATEVEQEYVERWLRVYLRKTPFTREELDVLWADPIIGWTAANALRRFDNGDGVTHDLSRLYDVSRATSDSSPRAASFRWRVVHGLGRATAEYQTLIRATFDAAENVNARYGAVRSLIEVAATRADVALRDDILETLRSRMSELFEESDPARVRKELRRCCAFNEEFVDGRPSWREEWLRDGLPKFADVLRAGESCASGKKQTPEAKLWKQWADAATRVPTDVGKWPERKTQWLKIIQLDQ
jgi:hypothetical protein